MPDWRSLVRERLAPYPVPAERAEEIAEELAQLLEDAYREAVSDGASEADAVSVALCQVPAWDELARELRAADSLDGGPTAPRHRPDLGSSPESARPALLGGLMHDLRFAVRTLMKQPGFALLAVLILGLGIGLNTSVFSLVNAVLFKPLPVGAPEELVRVYTFSAEDDLLAHQPTSFPNFRDIRDRSQGFEGVVAYTLTPFALERGEQSEFVIGEAVTGRYFETLGLKSAMGRLLAPADDAAGDPGTVAVLSHSSWTKRFGADPGIVGTQVRLNGHVITVVGVAPEGFQGLMRGLASELWVPLTLTRTLRTPATTSFSDDRDPPGLDRLDRRDTHWLWVMGRRASGVSLAQVQAELRVLGDQLEQEHPKTNEGRSFTALAGTNVRILPDFDGVLYAASSVLMALVGLVLLIASANVANMLLARAASRRREIAVRLSLGASRGRLVRQLLTESLLLAFLGGGLGLLLAVSSNWWLNHAQLPIPVQLALGLSIDWRVLGFTFAVSTSTAVFFGLAPALRSTRQDLSSVLKEEAGAAGGPSRRTAGRLLVVAQVGVSALLLVSAGLSLRSLFNAQRMHPGFEPAGVVLASLHPELRGYSEAQIDDFRRRLLARARALPGVESVAVASHVPLSFELQTEDVASDALAVRPREEWLNVDRAVAGPGYFQTLRVPILRGRGFEERDGPDGAKVAIVNEELASRLWPGQETLGQRLHIGRDAVYEVVGVARNGKYRTLGEDPRPFLYQPPGQGDATAGTLLVRIAGGAGGAPLALAAIRGAVREIDPKLPVAGLQTLEEAISTSLLLPRVSTSLFAAFGLLGLLLAGVGLYGVIAYAVSERTREIGVRVAMGARRRDILALVLRGGMGLTVLGLGLGLAAAAVATRMLSAVLYGVSTTDAVTFAGVSLFILFVAAVASYVPARRAAALDPVVALRSQ